MTKVLITATTALAGLTALLVANLPASAAGAAPASFAMCATCHSVTAGGPAKMGPHLAMIMGRKAGSVSGYAYSPALKGSGITWTAAQMDKWLQNPRALVPGNKMPFAGVSDKAKRAELIAYMKTL